MSKTINTRIQLKRDYLSNWNASDIVLKPGEVGVAYVDVAVKDAKGNIVHVPTALLKAGDMNPDNQTKFKDLPFMSALAADVYSWAKKEQFPVVVTGEGEVVANVEWVVDETYPEGTLVVTKTNMITPDELNAALAALDATITAPDGQYIKGFKQVDGLVCEPEYADLPTFTDNDTITTVAQGDGIDVTVEGEDTDARTYTVKHANTSDVENVTAQTRTYVTGLTFDEFGHVTGTTVATETVVDTDTTYTAGTLLELNGTEFSHAAVAAPTETAGEGRKYLTGITTDNHGHITGFTTATETVEDTTYTAGTGLALTGTRFDVNFDFAADLADGNMLQLIDKTTNAVIATFDASAFIKDGMLEDVEYNAENNTLTFTWNTAAGAKTDTVTLNDILDPYVAGTDIKIEGTTISHEARTAVDADAYKIGRDATGHVVVGDKLTKADVGLDKVDNKSVAEIKTEFTGTIAEGNDNFVKGGDVKTAIDAAVEAANKYADDNDANTTYTVAATENALEFTVTPSEGDAQTIKLVAPTVDTGVMTIASTSAELVIDDADPANIKISIADESYDEYGAAATVKTGVEDGSIVANKATNDADGNDIRTTYRKSADKITSDDLADEIFIIDCGTATTVI